MQLLVITLDDMNEFLQTLSALKENGLNGIVLPSTSLKHALLESKVDAAPLFGSLSKIMQRDFEASHTLLMLVREEKIDEIKEIVHSVAKELSRKGRWSGGEARPFDFLCPVPFLFACYSPFKSVRKPFKTV